MVINTQLISSLHDQHTTRCQKRDMSLNSLNDQDTAEENLKQFLASIFTTQEVVDVSELRARLIATSVDSRLICLLSVCGENGKTVAHEAAWRNMLEVVECIHYHLRSEQFYKLIGQSDRFGWLPLYYAFLSVRRNVPLQFVEKMIYLLLGSFSNLECSKLIMPTMSDPSNFLTLAAIVEAPSLALKLLGFLSESDRVEMLFARDHQSNTAFHRLLGCPDEISFTEHLCQMIPLQQLAELLKIEDARGRTPLHVASRKSGQAFTSLVSFLEQNEVEYFAGRLCGRIPFLHYLAKRFHQSYLVLVLSRLSDEVLLELLSQKSVGGLTLLHCVLVWDHVAAVEALSKRLSSEQFHHFLTIRERSNRGPLHYAVENECGNVLTFLVNELPCKHLVKLLDTQDDDGNTPFNSIIEKGSEEVKTLLLQKTFSYLTESQQVNCGDQPQVTNPRKRTRELEEEMQHKISRINETGEPSGGPHSAKIMKFGLNPLPIDGVCEMLVTVDHEELGKEAVYVIALARWILPDETLQQLMTAAPQDQVRQQLAQQAQNFHYKLEFRDQGDVARLIDAQGIPLVSYRPGNPENEEEYSTCENEIQLQRWGNDVVLLRVDSVKAEELFHKFHGLKGRSEDMIKVETPSKMNKYTQGNVPIQVKQKKGQLLPLQSVNDPEEMYYLELVLENNVTLEAGDYGSIVYEVRTKDGHPSLRPLAILVGLLRLNGNQKVYLAVCLHQAFQAIKAGNDGVKHICLYNGHERSKRKIRPSQENYPS